MSPRLRTGLAITLTALSAAMVVTALTFAVTGATPSVQASELMGATAFTAVGGLLAVRRGDNALSWLFAAVGFATSYLALNNHMPTTAIPGAQYFAWFGWWGFLLGVGIMGTFVLLLFPDGHLPTRRWRPVAWAAGAGLLLLGWSEALMPAERTGSDQPNPFAVPSLVGVLDILFFVGTTLLLVGILGSLAAVVVRFRRSRGLERQQLKWVAFAAAWGISFWLAANLVNSVWPISWDAAMTAVILPLPVAVAVAVLRYRLYDIDRVISRTVAYALLTVLLAGIYLAAVTALTAVTAPVAGESPIAVATATLLAAAAFGPARRRIQRAVDRRFNRARYDAAHIVDGYRAAVRDQVDLGTLAGHLLRAVDETVQPASASLWMREAVGQGDGS